MSAERSNNTAQRPHMGGRRGGPMAVMGMPVQKAKDFKGTLKRLIRYLKPHRINLIIVLIFAIASTAFTIAAPKVTSKAMNSLQDSYMAKTMLEKMSEAQETAVNKIYDSMTDAQSETVDKIGQQMGDAQVTAVNKINEQMSDAQKKAVNEINGQMGDAQEKAVSGIENQMAGVQNQAVAGIETQMGATQKQIMAQLNRQMQSAGSAGSQAPQMDPETMKAIQDFMKLPMIDSITDLNKKAATTIQMMDLLTKMPGAGQSSQQMSPKTVAAMKELLQLPKLNTVKGSKEKVNVALKLMDAFKNMPQSAQSSQKIDTKTFDTMKELLQLPMVDTVKDQQQKKNLVIKLMDIFKKMPQSSQSSQKIDTKTFDTMKELLQLPMVDTVKDQQQKKDLVIKLIDIFKKMPQSSQSSQKIDTKTFDTMKELLGLPLLNTVTEPNQKTDLLLKVLDVFKKLPASSQNSQASDGQQISPESLDTIKKLANMPKLSTIKDPQQKAETVDKMLDLFDKIPKQSDQNASTDKDNVKQMDPETISTMKELLKLPMLNTLKDADQKADVVQKFIDLGKKIPKDKVKGVNIQNTSENVELTNEQINGAINSIRETNGKYDFHYIGIIVLILVGMYLLSSAFNLVMGLVMSGVAQKTVRDLRREVDTKLSRLPLKYFDLHAHGDILSRVTNDVDTISTTLQQSLTQIITSVITIIGYIIMMLTISPVLTLIVIATLPLYIIATAAIAKKSQKYFAEQQKELGDLSGHVEEMYTGHKIVKAFGREPDAIEKFDDINSRLNTAGTKAQFVSGIMFPLMNFISNLGYVGISIIGGIWITNNRLGLGDILAFIQYSRSFTMPIIQTSNIANIIQSTVACAERVFEVLDEEEEIPDSKDSKTIEAPRGDVKFENVDFRYAEEVPLIENMNLDVHQGDTIAIVGPTGAGKTTLVNLLMRFYEINSGKISVDGVDIKDIKRSELRKLFGMVLQDTWLYNGTIKDNIAYSRENASFEDIVKAAKAAHADHFIRTLPEGYNTVLNEEATNISQGQKQLLTIARAILADPAILILDEATSSVDTRTEVLIQKAMANLMKGRTSFVIAHRLSTIRDADHILVMNKGKIIEQGSHHELLKQKGFYADLYNSQFTGADLDGEAV